MSTIQEIKEKRRELDQLENEYLRITPPCNNTDCALWREKSTGNCSWSVLLEDCNEYKSE